MDGRAWPRVGRDRAQHGRDHPVAARQGPVPTGQSVSTRGQTGTLWDIMGQGHPLRSTETMPVTIARCAVSCGRPPGVAPGLHGSPIAHAVVCSIGRRDPSRSAASAPPPFALLWLLSPHSLFSRLLFVFLHTLLMPSRRSHLPDHT